MRVGSVVRLRSPGIPDRHVTHRLMIHLWVTVLALRRRRRLDVMIAHPNKQRAHFDGEKDLVAVYTRRDRAVESSGPYLEIVSDVRMLHRATFGGFGAQVDGVGIRLNQFV